MILRQSSMLIVLFSAINFCWSLPEDNQQEIHIASDAASLDRLNGKVVYSGNVKMQQGSLSIEAQKVTLFTTANGLEKIIAEGLPAKYQQTLSADEGKTLAYGETIIYNTKIDKLTLLNNAGLEKQGNLFSGDKIIYLINEQRVQAESPEKDNRIRMIIQPKQDGES